MAFLRTLFSTTGLLIVVYIVVGVFVNTAPPHLPTSAGNISLLHNWVQYFISVFLWPLSFWHPTFSVGKWTN
jgi:succinate dehydrogenase/fumarate reductase cytochrome b subunit